MDYPEPNEARYPWQIPLAPRAPTSALTPAERRWDEARSCFEWEDRMRQEGVEVSWSSTSGGGLYLVPSSDDDNLYGVRYGDAEPCSCPDAARHPELVCKHVMAVGILNAKRRVRRGRCAGCGERRPLRELLEAREGDGMTHEAGERLCGPCARRGGIPS